MDTVAVDRRIGSAFVVFCGQHGDVSRFAQEQGVSRQWLYREADGVRDALEGTRTQPVIDRLRQDNAALQARVAELEQRLRVAVVIDEEKQAELACVGQGCGVTLPQCHTLLGVLITKPLSVPTLGRRTQARGNKSAELLEVFDEYARQQVREGAGDEIYVPAPVLMVVEQESLCWISGRLSEDVSGVAWSREFAQLPNLEQMAVDGGTALAKGLDLVNEQRQQQEKKPVVLQGDHFHALWTGGVGLRRAEKRAGKALAEAEDAQKALDARAASGRAAGSTASPAGVAAGRKPAGGRPAWCHAGVRGGAEQGRRRRTAGGRGGAADLSPSLPGQQPGGVHKQCAAHAPGRPFK